MFRPTFPTAHFPTATFSSHFISYLPLIYLWFFCTRINQVLRSPEKSSLFFVCLLTDPLRFVSSASLWSERSLLPLSWNAAPVVTFTVRRVPSNQPHLAIHLALSSLAEFLDCVALAPPPPAPHVFAQSFVQPGTLRDAALDWLYPQFVRDVCFSVISIILFCKSFWKL